MLTTTTFGKAPAGADPALKVPDASAVKMVLPNGLTLIVQEDRSAPVASVQAWCETGSIHEDAHLGAGLSHILEHMLFKGTTTRDTTEIAQAIQDQGGYINAYTSFDRTVYWIDIPSKGVETALAVLSDAMMNSTLPPEEYVKEQEVIRREFAMGFDDPDRVSTHRMFETAYAEHPYRLPVIGHLDIYNKLTREDVLRYYKERYVPNNMTFVVVGDVDANAVRTQLAEAFKEHPRKTLRPVYIPAEPAQHGRRDHHEEFPTELTRLDMVWHIPALIHPDTPVLDLLSTVIGHGRSSRLYREIREDQGLVHEISAFSYTPGDPGLFGVDATLDPGKREATEAAVLSLIGEIKENGVTEDELAKAKKQALSSHFHGLTTMRGKASDLGSSWMLTRNLGFSNDYLAAVQNVTVEDLKRVAEKYLHEGNLTVTSLNPLGSLKSDRDAAAVRAEVSPIQKFVLPNGLRLLVREDPRLPLVSMRAVFKAGLLVETEATNGISSLAARVLLKGTRTRSAEQIADAIEEVGGSISSDSGNNSVSVAARVMAPDLELGLDVLADVLLHPAWPTKAIGREKEVQLAGLKAEDEEPTSVARNLMRRTLFPGHPYGYRGLGTEKSIGALDAEALRAFHREYFVATNGVLAVFGDVDAEEVKALVEKTLGAMPSGEEALVAPPAPEPLEGDAVVEEIRDKQQAVLMVGFRGTDLFSPDRWALELIDEASSDLGSRFFIRIREEMGLAYYVGTTQMAGLVPGPFVFYLGTAPEKVEEVKAEFLDEIGKLAANGLTAAELERAKEKLVGQDLIRNQSNGALAYMTALDELYGVGYDEYLKVPETIRAVTLEEVKAVAAKYFNETPEVIAVVRPDPAKESD
jgi:zinc protease